MVQTFTNFGSAESLILIPTNLFMLPMTFNLSLLTDKIIVSSASRRTFHVLYPTYYQHFIRQLADCPVRDLILVEKKLTHLSQKSRRDVMLTRHSANSCFFLSVSSVNLYKTDWGNRMSVKGVLCRSYLFFLI